MTSGSSPDTLFSLKIFCSGIGGIGISAYASLQKLAGHDVFGTDRSSSSLLDDLQSQGIRTSLIQDGSSVREGIDLFVYSEAIPPDAPERIKAQSLGIPQKSYPEALGEFMKGYKVIAVCGTHGKSSTTAMAARMLMLNGYDPTVVVGTKMKELEGRNWRKGRSDYLVLEACEYRRSFLHYAPSIVLFTNCDGDHFDYYESIEDYHSAFLQFFRGMDKDGTIVCHGLSMEDVSIAKKSGRNIVDADQYPLISLQTPGYHMQQNAQLVLGLADVLNIPQQETREAVQGYAGSWRRMEKKGVVNDVTIIDDYAHHPTEIRATLQAMRSAYPGQRIVTVFQPHTHDRTKKLYQEFLTCFRDTDLLIIPDIYVARNDIETDTVSVKTLAEDIARSSNIQVIDGISMDNTEHLLLTNILRKGDVLLCMGAGTVTNLAAKMASSGR